MNICAEHGDEIAYSGNYCPACDQIEDTLKEWKEEYDSTVSDLDLTISDLESEVDDLQLTISDLEAKLNESELK